MARKVAIWGSCVTRDAFALPDLQQWVEDELPLVYYGARSSWVSQASPPMSVDIDGLSGFPQRMIIEDAAKTIVDALVAAEPDIVVLDLTDERLPIARFGQTWLTSSDYFRQLPDAQHLLAAADELVSMTSPRRAELFTEAARRLSRVLVRRLPRTAFVLNEAPYTTRVGDGTEMPEPQAGWARDLQAGQQPLVAALVRGFGDRMLRARPPEEVCLADPDHRWGVTSYHYVDDYYRWLLGFLDAVEPPVRPGRGISLRLPDAPRDVLRRVRRLPRPR